MTDAALGKLIESVTRTDNRRRLADAVVGFRAALLAQPDYRPAYQGLAVALKKLGRVAEAEAVLRTALERHNGAPELHLLLGEILADWGEIDAAMEEAQKAIGMARGDAEPATFLASLHLLQGQAGLARIVLESACDKGLPFAPALTLLGRLQRQAGDLERSLETLKKAIDCARKTEDQALAHTQHAISQLAAGNIKAGFKEFDWRWKTGLLQNLNPGCPPWTGDPLKGRSLLIRYEQGMSECLQFFALAAQIEGGRTIVEAPRALVPLLRASHRVSEVIAEGDPLPDVDCWVPLLSLPRVLQVDQDTIPCEVPYLRADPSLHAKWRDRMGPGPKIAIAWCGGEALFEERQRYIPLADFEPLSRVEGIRLYSLQKGEGRQEIDHVPFPVYDMTDEMDEGEGAFIDTAVVIEECALVITADTAIAHLAGALGRPCWCILPEGGDWRFGWHPSRSPWYPTMECLRRPKDGEWRDVFDYIARHLTALREGQTSHFPSEMECDMEEDDHNETDDLDDDN